jgi:hypothetical protein
LKEAIGAGLTRVKPGDDRRAVQKSFRMGPDEYFGSDQVLAAAELWKMKKLALRKRFFTTSTS